MSFCLGLPLLLFPSILPSVISLCRESPLIICHIQLFCLVLIMSIKDLFSFISFGISSFSTSPFVVCSVQLIHTILLHIHTSKAFIRLTSSFLIVNAYVALLII